MDKSRHFLNARNQYARTTEPRRYARTTEPFSRFENRLRQVNVKEKLKNNCRNNSFTHAISLIKKRNLKRIIEFGAMRTSSYHEGHSTIIFALLSKYLNIEFHSIDIDPESIDLTRKILTRRGLLENVILKQECQFSRIYSDTEPYDFVYIDATDKDLVLEKLIENKSIASGGVILIDDCTPSEQLDKIFKVINKTKELKPIPMIQYFPLNDEEKKYFGMSKDNPLNKKIQEHSTQIILEFCFDKPRRYERIMKRFWKWVA